MQRWRQSVLAKDLGLHHPAVPLLTLFNYLQLILSTWKSACTISSSVHDQLRFLGHRLQKFKSKHTVNTPHMPQLTLYTSRSSRQNKTWSSWNRLCGLHPETDRKKNERTHGLDISQDWQIWRGRVRRFTTTRLHRERKKEYQSSSRCSRCSVWFSSSVSK